MRIKVLCRCGHEKREHQKDYIVCVGCFTKYEGWKRNKNTKALELGCRKFVPDNLDYIEKLAKSRGLV